MTEILYLPEPVKAYETTFQARVVDATKDHLELDRTLFYATGGGQPYDTGEIRWQEGKAKVVDVHKQKGTPLHKVQGQLPEPGTEITGEIDWTRREQLMRMHTSQHILSAVVYEQFDGAQTKGNTIHTDYSRVDFDVDSFSDQDLEDIQSAVNDVVAADKPVKGYEEDRESLEARIDTDRTLMHLIPDFIQVLRVVEIPEVDICPCAGTHVQRTGEIGEMNILRTENKGSGRTRIVYELRDA